MATRGLILAATLAALALPVLGQDEPDCGGEPLSQSYRWTRTFQGIEDPVTWTVTRETRFSDPDDSGLITARETLRLQVPEFRFRFQQYLGSARVDSCETRFDVLARTPTASLRALSLPLVVDYQSASCSAVDPDCVESANLIGECHRQERRLHTVQRAEFDVDFLFELKTADFSTRVTPMVYPVYGSLDAPQAKAYLQEALETGGAALGLLAESLGQIALARLAPDLAPVSVEGGFVDSTGSAFELASEYRLSQRQLCRARFKIEDFGRRHRRAP